MSFLVCAFRLVCRDCNCVLALLYIYTNFAPLVRRACIEIATPPGLEDGYDSVEAYKAVVQTDADTDPPSLIQRRTPSPPLMSLRSIPPLHSAGAVPVFHPDHPHNRPPVLSAAHPNIPFKTPPRLVPSRAPKMNAVACLRGEESDVSSPSPPGSHRCLCGRDLGLDAESIYCSRGENRH